MPEFRPQTKVALLLAVFAITAMLHLGQEILMPLALSVLIAFLLTPIVVKLESWGLGRAIAVVVTALTAFIVIGFSLYIVTSQLVDLADSLPGYKDNLHSKVSAVRPTGHGPFQKVADTVRELSGELSKPPPDAKPALESSPKPMEVRVVEPATSPFTLARIVSASLLGPLGTGAVVVVFVIFMLIERRDLRDRFIHLVGRGQLRITTQAIDEAADRVSRYLLAQLIVNVTYGIPIGVGLYFIGIPNAALWGILATVLRFVPYIGPWIAASFPVILSFAVAPGWGPLAATVALFVVIELVSNNAVEPWLYGASTGLSATAIVVSAVFWTWLWGAGGLLLATPLTVCLAVIGKYVPTLSFLDVILGDHPPIAPEHRFYQRLLAGDETELFETVEEYDKRNELGGLFDEIIVPAMQQAEQDYSIGDITREERGELFQRIRDALASIEEWNPEREGASLPVTIVPARTEGDYLCGMMLAHLLEMSGLSASVVSHQALNSEVAQRLQHENHQWLCLSVLHSTTSRGGEILIRRLQKGSTRGALLGLWGTLEHEGSTPNGIEIVRTLRDAAHNLRERVSITTVEPAAEPAAA